MPINVDLSGLPTGPDPDGAWPPDRDDTWGREMVRAWLDTVDPDVPFGVALPEAGPMRASQAAMCARAISYSIDPDLEVPPTPLKDRWRYYMGTLVHEHLLGHWASADTTVALEVPVDLNPIGVPGSAHADAVIYGPDREVLAVVEAKTVNGTGFKQMATGDRGPATGPRLSYQLQAGLIGLALGAPEVRILVLSFENAADWHVARYGTPRDNPEAAPFLAQWTIPTETLRPQVEREAKRLARIAELAAAGERAPRALVDDDIPPQARVVDPSSGAWELHDQAGNLVAAGEAWQCRYCEWQDLCAKDPQ